MKRNSFFLGAIFLVVYFKHFVRTVEGIGCFVCTSVNGSEPFCEDSFNTTHVNVTNVDFYQPNCLAGRKDRNGLFIASHCVKIKGTYWNSDTTLYIRTCSLDSNSLTMDTELSRVEQSCGNFGFVPNATWEDHPSDPDTLHGCINVCDDIDGCNGGVTQVRKMSAILLMSYQCVIYIIRNKF